MGQQLHHRRQRPACFRRVHRDADDGLRVAEHDHLHGPRRQSHAQVRSPLRPPAGDVRGLQRLGRQVSLLRHRRWWWRGHRRRHPARRQGLLRATDERPAGGQPLHRPRLLPDPVAGEGGLRRLLHRRHLGLGKPLAAAGPQNRHRLRPQRVLVRRTDERLLRRPECRRQHLRFQRQHRLLEGALRGQLPNPRLLQDRRGLGLQRQRPGRPERLGPGRQKRHRRRCPRPRPDRRHRRRQPAELDHDLARQRRAPRRPERARRRPRRTRQAGEHAVRQHVPGFAAAGRCLPAAGPGRQLAGSVRRRSDLAQHRDLDQQHDHDRQPPGRLGVGRDPNPTAVPQPRAGRGEAAHQLHHPAQRRRRLAPGRGPDLR